jgi:hypothetical protein
MNGDNPSRQGASMIDREPLERSDHSGRKPQIAAVGSPTGWPGPSEPCLMRRTDP